MDSPSVSILLTVYNGLPYLEETIGSVMHQSYDDFEFLVVDDGSTDGTQTLLEEFDDSRIRTIFREHLGRGAALNLGLRAARGEFIAIIDADDVAYPTRLERQETYLRENPEVAVIGTWFHRLFSETDNVELARPDITGRELEVFAESNPIAHSTSMYRRDAALDVGGYDDRLTSCIDYEFWVKLAASGYKFDILEEPLCKIRKHEGQSFRVTGKERFRHHWNAYRVRSKAIRAGELPLKTHVHNARRFVAEMAATVT